MNRIEMFKEANEKLKTQGKVLLQGAAKKGPITTPDGRRNTPAAAEYLGCSISKMGNMRSNGKGPAYIKRGGIWYFKEDLDAWTAGLREARIIPHNKGGAKSNRGKHLALRVTDETFKGVEKAAQDTHRTASNWVETAILWALDQGAVHARQVVPRPKGDR